MMIRGDWRDFRGGPQPSQPFRAASGLFVALFLVAWVCGTAILVAALALMLRFL